MERDFAFHNPVKVFFGRTAMENLPGMLSRYGQNVLLAYGGGSIKANGVYDQVMACLRACGKTVTEFSGIMANPTYTKVLEGARLARGSNADLILAVGGGSVIDCAKAVSIFAVEEGDLWTKYWLEKGDPETQPLPVGAIVTVAGTGSELDGDAVITHEETKVKASCSESAFLPDFAILNPEFTYSVPQYHMVSGIFDTFSHIMEAYFSPTDTDNISDDFSEALSTLLLRDETRNQLTFSPVVYLPYFFAFILGRTLSMRSTVLIIFPVSGSFSVNQFFMSGGQSIGASVSAPAFQ